MFSKKKNDQNKIDLNDYDKTSRYIAAKEKMLELINVSSYITTILTLFGIVTFLPVGIIGLIFTSFQSVLKLKVKSQASKANKQNMFRVSFVVSRMRLIKQRTYRYTIDALSARDLILFETICLDVGKSRSVYMSDLYSRFEPEVSESEFMLSMAQLQRFGLVNVISIFHYWDKGAGIDSWSFQPDIHHTIDQMNQNITFKPAVITSAPAPTIFGMELFALLSVALDLQLDSPVIKLEKA